MFLGRSLHSSGEPETHYIPQGNSSAGLGVLAYIGRRMRQEDLEFEVSLGYTMIFTLKKNKQRMQLSESQTILVSICSLIMTLRHCLSSS